MQRELRPKRELLTLLQRLNDCVGISARRMYTHEVTLTELLQSPLIKTRRFLPELCRFVDSLLPTSNNNTIIVPPSSLVRRAFHHPEAQWLSRSARQSGISALLCQQLVRLARQDGDNNKQDRDKTIYWSAAERTTIYWSAAELTMHVLLDALLSSCAQRLGQAPDACKWCPLQPKPRFHAMMCFPIWSALSPFVAIMGIRFPDVFQRVLTDHRHLKRKSHRVNCDFARVTGIWRLVEELDRGDKKKQKAVTDAMASLLRLASDRVLLGSKKTRDDVKPVDLHLEDQLLEKFFTGMQNFSFKSGRADEMLKQTLFGALKEALTGSASGPNVRVVPQRVVVFTIAGCMLVKNLAVEVVSMVIEQMNDVETSSYALLPWLVGFCAHVDLVPLTSVLEVLELLMTLYKAAAHDFVHPGEQKQRQREMVFYIVYMTLFRSKCVDSLRREVSFDAAAVLELLKQFQMRLCSEIAYEDFQVAAPVHWTAHVWKHWVFLSDEEVQSFVSEAQENDTDTEQEFKKRVATWQAWEALVAFKLSSFSRFTQMKASVNPHLISTPLFKLNDENGLMARARKRRRTEKFDVKPEQLERLFDVLLLPDVMERVCSFMSAKRLCRMTLVCRAFAEISRRASLWRHLYLQSGSSIGKKQSVRLVSPVECHHGGSYKHNWRQLYQERWLVLRKLRRLQCRTMKAMQSSGRQGGTNVGDTSSSNITFIPLLCAHCGCNQVLKSASKHAVHETLHQQLTCPERSCQASFVNVPKWKQHMKTVHLMKRTTDLSTRGWLRSVPLSQAKMASHCHDTTHSL